MELKWPNLFNHTSFDEIAQNLTHVFLMPTKNSHYLCLLSHTNSIYFNIDTGEVEDIQHELNIGSSTVISYWEQDKLIYWSGNSFDICIFFTNKYQCKVTKKNVMCLDEKGVIFNSGESGSCKDRVFKADIIKGFITKNKVYLIGTLKNSNLIVPSLDKNSNTDVFVFDSDVLNDNGTALMVTKPVQEFIIEHELPSSTFHPENHTDTNTDKKFITT